MSAFDEESFSVDEKVEGDVAGESYSVNDSKAVLDEPNAALVSRTTASGTPETEADPRESDSVDADAEQNVPRRAKSASNSLSSASTSSAQDSCYPTDDGGDSMTSSIRSDEPQYNGDAVFRVKVHHKGRQDSLVGGGAGRGGVAKPEERKNVSRRGTESKRRVHQHQQQQQQLHPVQPQASTPRDNSSVNSLSPRSQSSNTSGCTSMNNSRSVSHGRIAISPSTDGTGLERSQPPSRSSAAPSTGSKSISTNASYEFDDRSPGGVLAPPYGRVEPKFEPRFSHYKANTVEGVKWDTALFVQHRHKISVAKPIVDNKPPTRFTHVHVNMRKLKLAQDRQDEIERDNKLLLGKLVRAMTTTRIDNWNDVDHVMKPSLRSQQRRNIMQVAAENRKMLQRLNERKSTVSSSAYYARQYDEQHIGLMSMGGHHQRHRVEHHSAQQRHKQSGHQRHDSDGGAYIRSAERHERTAGTKSS